MTPAKQQALDNLKQALSAYQGGPKDLAALASIRKHKGWSERALGDLSGYLTDEEKQTLAEAVATWS